MDGWLLPLCALGVWLAVGVGVGFRLERGGHSAATAASALVAWPALLPLLSAVPTTSASSGPFASRIAVAFASLRATVNDPAAGPVPWSGELDALQTSLARADERLGLVDRVLSDADPSDERVRPAVDRLTHARAHAAAEIEGVLAGVVQLRLQVGLLALAGDDHPVRDRLRELAARARALSEVELADGETLA
jgi:hypothetical protein